MPRQWWYCGARGIVGVLAQKLRDLVSSNHVYPSQPSTLKTARHFAGRSPVAAFCFDKDARAVRGATVSDGL